MNGIIRIFRLLLRIDARLAGVADILLRIEKNQQGQLPSQVAVNWLDNQDVMQKLHISESTLKRRRLDGTIRSVRIKGKYYYREADLVDLLS